MFNESSLKKLAAQARLEPSPAVDVVDQVMSRLQASPRVIYYDDRPLAWITAIAAAAAIPIAAAGLFCWTQLTDPLMQAFYTMAW
jgi:hypothetical protein